MKFVAFLRNVNLGQPRSPTREQLESAFLQAGATAAASFLTNGTLVYDIPQSRLAQSTADRACEILRQVCGLQEPAFARSFHHLARLASEDPFSIFDSTSFADRIISFFKSTNGTRIRAPIESVRKDCLIFRIDAGEAFSITREVDGETGYPARMLERALGSPVTTRRWRTILRLVEKHGPR